MGKSLIRCFRCTESKVPEEFYGDRSRSTGRRAICKVCDKARAREFYATVRDRRSAQYRERRDGPTGAVHNHTRNRLAAIAVYGGECVSCGATAGLEFDHVQGGGSDHRKIETHHALWARIARGGVSLSDVDLQLLCRPCHMHKGKTEEQLRAIKDKYMNAWLNADDALRGLRKKREQE